MGTQKDWQQLDKHIDQALPKPDRFTPFLESFAIDSVEIPYDVMALTLSELVKELGRLKSQCLKTDGTTKLAAKPFDLTRLKHLWCRWQREKSSVLG